MTTQNNRRTTRTTSNNLGYERRYRIELDDHTWKFLGRWERVTITFSPDGRSFRETWEVTEDGSKWKPLCDLQATKVS